MRASRQEQIGGAGISEVSAAFERLGWGVVENSRHDLGTDLFAMARDERLFDLGLIVGIQVKAGDSYFREPVRASDGSLLGWYWRDDERSHLDDWASHAVPHLIVLHDLDTRQSYWVHITSDVVVPTGKGAKVLVPRANTVDQKNRDALLEVAATLRPGVAWEGSAWTGAGSLAPRDVLRHALVVPRLVAPHRNSGYRSTLTPEQALALLVQVRLHDLHQFAKSHQDVPMLTEAMSSPLWAWRFVGALSHRLTTGDVDCLLSLPEEAPNPAARAASIVVAAAGLLENGRAEEAIALLEVTLALNESEPVDHAWLSVQRARACAEVGRVDEARAEAIAVQEIRATHSGDVTATAIAGVAAVLLFNASALGEQDLADVITGMDTAAMWWRTQTMSWGLTALAKRTFKEWARDTSVTFGGSDSTNDYLLAASLMANHAGDHDGWRHLSGLLGQNALLQLDRHSDPEVVRQELDTLRLAGDKAALKLVVERIALDGPATAITLAAAALDMDASTRTTGPADLALLQHGGDLLDEASADRSMDWLLTTLRDPSAFMTRTTPSYLLDKQLLDTIAAVVPATSPTVRRVVIDNLIVLASQEDQLLATSWSRVVDALPNDAWDRETALRIWQNADIHHDVLRLALVGIAARYHPPAKAQLVEEVREGSFVALGALGDVRTLPIDAVTNMVAELTDRVVKKATDARAGRFGGGGQDVGYTLALLNVWHPAAANWNSLIELLEDSAVATSDKRGALLVLASLADRLPDEVRPRLRSMALTVAQQTPPVQVPLFGFNRDVAGVASDLAVVLSNVADDTTHLQVIDLLDGGADHRQWAARIASRRMQREDIGVLVVLAQDPAPAVRAASAACLASLVASGHGGRIAADSLQRCLRDPGTLVASSIAASLADAPARSAEARELLTQLCSHASAYVRATAARALRP